MSVLGRATRSFGDWVRAPARPERLALLRVLVTAYGVVWLVARAPHLWDVTRFADDRWRPIGVLAGLDRPPSASVVALVVTLAVVSGVAALVGWRYRIAAPVFAVSLLLATTWRNSWGQIFHTENLLVLHLFVLALVPAAAAWSVDARRSHPSPRPDTRFGGPIRIMALLTVATYVVAGVAKVRFGGAAWLDGDVLAHQIAFDNVRKAAVGSPTSPLTGLLLDARWLLTPMAVATLLVELGSPLALLSRRAAQVWAAAAWGFHVAILATMVIVFAYPLSVVALVPVLLVHGQEAPLPRVRAWVAGRLPAARAGARPLARTRTLQP